jgi:hypothetical protein
MPGAEDPLMVELRCTACADLVAQRVPEARARHIERTVCHRCEPVAAR